MEGGDVDQEEKGGEGTTLGGPYRDRSGYVRSALEDERSLSSSNEGRDPVDHVGGYVLGKEEGQKLCRIDIVKAVFYVKEEGGYLQEGSLEGPEFIGQGGHSVRGAEAREGAALVRMEQAGLPRK